MEDSARDTTEQPANTSTMDPPDRAINSNSRTGDPLFSERLDVNETDIPYDPDDADVLEPVRATFRLTHRNIVLTDVSRMAPRVQIRPVDAIAGEHSTLLVVSVQGDDLSTFDEVLETADSVDEAILLDCFSDRRTYRVAMAADTYRVTTLLVQSGAYSIDLVGSRGRWKVVAQFRSNAAFSMFRSHCIERGASFQLDRLHWGAAGVGGSQTGLTTDQRETLRLAHEAGYFDIPRGTSQTELAKTLGISPSAVSQRLRRAMQQLLNDELRTDV